MTIITHTINTNRILEQSKLLQDLDDAQTVLPDKVGSLINAICQLELSSCFRYSILVAHFNGGKLPTKHLVTISL